MNFSEQLSLLSGAAAAGADAAPTASPWQLAAAFAVGIAIIVVLIAVLKVYPFLALVIGALVTGVCAGFDPAKTIGSFTTGFGATMGGVGILIALGAMFGKLLADTGGADRVVDTLVSVGTTRSLPWIMGLIGAIIGLPMFFEVGLVLLVPVIILVARRSGVSLMKIAIPTLAGLSAMHGFVPPHPGPLAAIDILGANLGLTLGLGALMAIPAVIIAGPLFGNITAKWVHVPVPNLFITAEDDGQKQVRRPSFAAALVSILLPVILMMLRAVADIVAPGAVNPIKATVDFLGTPVMALLVTVIVAFFLLGRGAGFGRTQLARSVESSLGPVAGILLVVAAGGGFKQVLVDSGIGEVIANLIAGSGLSILFLAWLVAVVIRVATGSATVATITAAGIVQPLTAGLEPAMTALLVIAIGAGSLFLSHVNDAGFWLIKEYFGLSISQTLRSWTVLVSVISVTGLLGTLAVSAFL